MCVPIICSGECLVDAVVKVLVMGKDNMATDIVELNTFSDCEFELGRYSSGKKLTKPSGVTSVEASPPGVSFESIIIHEGPFYHHGQSCLIG